MDRGPFLKRQPYALERELHSHDGIEAPIGKQSLQGRNITRLAFGDMDILLLREIGFPFRISISRGPFPDGFHHIRPSYPMHLTGNISFCSWHADHPRHAKTLPLPGDIDLGQYNGKVAPLSIKHVLRPVNLAPHTRFIRNSQTIGTRAISGESPACSTTRALHSVNGSTQ